MAALNSLPAEVARDRAEKAARWLAADPRVQMVYFFGSAAEPAAETVGDIDLGVLTEPRLPLMGFAELAADAEQAAGGGVHLVDLAEASVVLAHEVARHGRCLFATRPEVAVEFAIRAAARYWDFKPFLDEQWRLVGERQEKRLHGA